MRARSGTTRYDPRTLSSRGVSRHRGFVRVRRVDRESSSAGHRPTQRVPARAALASLPQSKRHARGTARYDPRTPSSCGVIADSLGHDTLTRDGGTQPHSRVPEPPSRTLA
ncbi:hypothetical protein B0H12DRAFT_1134569 [Mycena haematopus]|nr:hypothetical protein B0H12DRAFT_1134544 [Mycena haematopus]KAJ7240663.1 hypothetical protein B0H12DRAFT_1134556 [Mycena haematopus]KAJ7240665.1 hypothetical protein B0H12DRAFT_1134569 [Mycena haematopus]